jgi:hypothetical protein
MGILASVALALTLVAQPVHPPLTLPLLTLLLQQIHKMTKEVKKAEKKKKKKKKKTTSEAYIRPPQHLFGA